MYALNIGMDGRILSATYPQYTPGSVTIVEALPDGDITDYRYSDGEYVYDPLPKTVEDEASPDDATLEARVDALEATTDDMILLLAERIGGN